MWAKTRWILVHVMAHLAFESFVTCPICAAETHFYLWSDPLLTLEVFLNPAPLATCLCLLLRPEHLSTCPSASLTSCSGPRSPTALLLRLLHPPAPRHKEINGALSLARLFRGPALRIGKCQSLTGGGGGTEAGWKMSSFTGKSCEPRNISSSSIPSPHTFPPHPSSLSVGARWGVCVCVCVYAYVCVCACA